MLHSAITTALALGAVLLFPGNVYNFGAGMPSLLDAHAPAAQPPWAQVRVALEQQLAQAVATQGCAPSSCARATSLAQARAPGWIW